MKKNEAKKELENYVFDMKFFNEKSKERESIKDKVQMSIQRVKTLEQQSNGDNTALSSMKSSLDRIIDVETKEETVLIEILEKKQRVESVIEKLDSLDRTIIYMRYVQAYSFDQIAYKLNYSTKRIYQLHTIALDNFADLYVKMMQN